MQEEVLIHDVEAFLNQHDEIHVENVGKLQIRDAKKNGVIKAGNESRPLTVNIDDRDVTVIR